MDNGEKGEKRRRQNRESQRRFRDRHRKKPENTGDGRDTPLSEPKKAISGDEACTESHEHMPVSPGSTVNATRLSQGSMKDPILNSQFPGTWDGSDLASLGTAMDLNAHLLGQEDMFSSVSHGSRMMSQDMGRDACVAPDDISKSGGGTYLNDAGRPQHQHHIMDSLACTPTGDVSTNNLFPTTQTWQPNKFDLVLQASSVDQFHSPRRPRMQYPPPSPKHSRTSRKSSRSSASSKRQTYTPFGHLKPPRLHGSRESSMQEKVDLMIGEIQEIYRVGVVLGLFPEDLKLRKHMEAVRKRFQALTNRQLEKARCTTSSSEDGCNASSDSDSSEDRWSDAE